VKWAYIPSGREPAVEKAFIGFEPVRNIFNYTTRQLSVCCNGIIIYIQYCDL